MFDYLMVVFLVWLEPGDRGPITGMNVAPWLRWSCAGRGPAYWGMEHSAETAARKHRHHPPTISANKSSGEHRIIFVLFCSNRCIDAT